MEVQGFVRAAEAECPRNAYGFQDLHEAEFSDEEVYTWVLLALVRQELASIFQICDLV